MKPSQDVHGCLGAKGDQASGRGAESLWQLCAAIVAAGQVLCHEEGLRGQGLPGLE